MPLLDLRKNPFQEEGNDEGKVEIKRVIGKILKIMQASVEEELGFNKTWPFVSKLARSRPERKPI